MCIILQVSTPALTCVSTIFYQISDVVPSVSCKALTFMLASTVLCKIYDTVNLNVFCYVQNASFDNKFADVNTTYTKRLEISNTVLSYIGKSLHGCRLKRMLLDCKRRKKNDQIPETAHF